MTHRLRPDLLDGLAQEYVMFTMHPQTSRRFEALLHRSPAARTAVQSWQECAARLALGLRPRSPSPRVRQALEARISHGHTTADQHTTASHAPSRSVWRDRLHAWLQGWRPAMATLATLVIGLVVGLGTAHIAPDSVGLEASTDTVPASYIGVLTNRHNEAALLVSSRRQGHTVQLKLLHPLALPAGKVARLWAYPSDGSAPFAVATLPTSGKATVALPKAAEVLFANVTRLAVSADDPQTHPTPPTAAQVLLQGHCAKLW